MHKSKLFLSIMVNYKSAKKYCCEDISKIENYAEAIADNSQTWELHHKLECEFSDGTPRPTDARLSVAELIALDMYLHRPASELIFLTRARHNSLHHKGAKLPEETRSRMSAAKKGREITWSMKISEAHKRYWQNHQHSAEARKKLSAATKGSRWYNNGVINVRAFECPEGFVLGILRPNRKSSTS